MILYKKTKFLFAVCVLIFLNATVEHSYADTSTPTYAPTTALYGFKAEGLESYSGQDGTSTTGRVEVENRETTKINIVLEGLFNNTKGIITFSSSSFDINPGETKSVEYTMNIPQNYCSGTYRVSLIAALDALSSQSDNDKIKLSVGTAIGEGFDFTVNSSNACPTTTIVAVTGGGGGGGGGSVGGSSSSGGGGGSGVGSSTVSTNPAPISRFDVSPGAESTTLTPTKETIATLDSSNSCLLLNSDTDSVAGAEVLNPKNARLLAMGKKVVEKYGKIIKKFENKTKIKSVFRDMKNRSSLKYIAALYDMGILADLSDKNFKPNKNVNRAEFLKLVILATNEKFSQKSLKAIAAFEDVHKRSWYAKYIAYGLNNKLIEGYSDKTFKPKNPVNQVEALKMIFSTFGIKPEAGLNYSYQDIPADVWYKDIAYTSIYHCIVKQPKNGKFIPNKIITREEAALLIYRVLKIQDDQSKNGAYTAIVGQK